MRSAGRLISCLGFVIGIAMTNPEVSFDSPRGSTVMSAPRLTAPGLGRPPSRPRTHRFHGFGLLGGIGGQQIVIIQQVQPAASIVESREPKTNKVYVQPRWVDAGHGVEILQPGYWAERTPSPKSD